LPTETLQDRDAIVADAVNRKKDGVGAAHNPGEQSLAFLHATIVVQKLSLGLFDKGPNALDVPMTPSNVQESSAFERGRKGPRVICVSALWGRELRFSSGQFVTQLLSLRIGIV